jgi:hypothetical protein
MRRLRRDDKRERGQILVLFELVLIVILGFAAMAIDLGVLRNNRQILVNTLDAAALAGGSSLPVDGSVTGKYAAELKLIHDTIAKDYPGLRDPEDYTISFRCLIGVNAATQALFLSEIPGDCDPTHALGHTPVASDFIGAGSVRHSPCNPNLGDKCNVVVITGSAITNYALAPVVGVNSGSTGLVTSAACKGPCGNPQTVSPVDLVIILDRTGSMIDGSNRVGTKIQSLETAAKTVLSVYDPAKQRVALGLTGPGKVDASGNPVVASCSPGSGSAAGVSDDSNFSPHATLTTTGTTTLSTTGILKTSLTASLSNSGAVTVKVASFAGFPGVGINYTIQVGSEQMLVTLGQGTLNWTVTNANRGINGTSKASHAVNDVVSWGLSNTDTSLKVASKTGFPTSGFYIQIDNERMLVTGNPDSTTWTVTRGQDTTTAATHGGNSMVSYVIVGTSGTSISVASKSGFPTSGSFTIQIDSEHMLVTGNPDSTTWTVLRNQDGMGAASHTSSPEAVTRVVGKTDTTIQVTAPYGPSSSFPSVPFTIAVGLGGSTYEHMLVTVVSGSSAPYTWTVTRATDGTPAATHNTGDDVDGVAPWVPGPSTVGVWIPVGLSGTDIATPPPAQSGTNGTYSIGGVVQTGTPIVKSIVCISAQSNGTNLSTPIRMAQWYLDHYGRAGVTQGIILETDGHPQVGFESGDQTTTNSAYTCQAAVDAAAAAKADYTNSPLGIQIFTIGYGVDSSSKCPTYTSSSTASNASYSKYETATWSAQPATTLLRTMATNPSYFFDNPSSAALAGVFTQAAQILANTKDHLIQLYPQPVVTHAGGPIASVTITGEYFTGASNVYFGAVSAQILSVSDTSITAKVPAGPPANTVVDVTVRTPGGLSVVTSADKYTYPP